MNIKFYGHSCPAAGLLSITFAFGNGAIAAETVAGPQAQSGMTRYVWANNLIMRAQPDSKGTEVVRLPFGTAVTLEADASASVTHQETVLVLPSSKSSVPVNVTLDGTWQRVRLMKQEGWVFDGYLSRYPVPKRSEEGDPDGERTFAMRVFGGQHLQKWDTGASTKTSDYRAMLLHTTADDRKQKQLSWSHVEFQQGGSYEQLYVYTEIGFSRTAFRNLPLTFNEAVLWVRQFGAFKPQNVGPEPSIEIEEFKPGHKLDIEPNDNSTLPTSSVIECSAKTCSISYDSSD